MTPTTNKRKSISKCIFKCLYIGMRYLSENTGNLLTVMKVVCLYPPLSLRYFLIYAVAVNLCIWILLGNCHLNQARVEN